MKTIYAIIIIFISVLSINVHADEEQKIGSAEFYWLLDRACAYDDELSVEMLLKAGADASGVKDYAAFLSKYNKGFEPSWHLCQAAYGGNIKIIRLLLKYGADPNLSEGEGVTALTIAADKGHIDIVRLLLEAGADKNYKTPLGTAIELAESKGRKDIVDLIKSFKSKTP